MVLESIDDVFSDLRDNEDDENLLVNNYEDILDETISTGETGWQIYGSKKPGGKPYKLTYLYKCEYDDEGETFDLTSESAIGAYVRNHLQDDNFPEAPLTFSFEKDEKSTYNGIDLVKGGFVSKAEYLY